MTKTIEIQLEKSRTFAKGMKRVSGRSSNTSAEETNIQAVSPVSIGFGTTAAVPAAS